MSNKRFTTTPSSSIADSVTLAKIEEYDEYLNSEKRVDFTRWKKFTSSGATTTYLERKKPNPDSKLPETLMTGTLPGTLNENMFGLVSPTLESMRIKASYLNDFSAAAVLATIVEPTVAEPLRSVVIKWMEIDIPGASIGIVRNRDYVYLESTGILCLKNGRRVGYHLLHSVNFPQTSDLLSRVRGNMSLCGVFSQAEPGQTDCRGTGVMDPGGDMIRVMAVVGMIQATMAVNQGVKIRKVFKKLSFITPDLELSQRKVSFCVKCLLDTNMDTLEAARQQFVYSENIQLRNIEFSLLSSGSDATIAST
ncbi:hypothetical protein PHYSODRAFT_324331 [Phytophthora sojae]|uniref:START domain-containing protein n=1 Tax=Phytophthora sojae (strain P6497) TaxID=1094619 RepID=G4YTZ5_PHYSP|nr:hypothetical protein PHYSODRAFT_324331 [Phytophthora sojae]EGZ23073.1 hypothetical protein PHYSODRAFT_324331 [Phytophthora sojae]|eukprot:XP_009518361.1 hypothetical protein PHYSODRAFT_324331 [Phytophthora sojae]